MPVTSIDIDPDLLAQAKIAAGTRTTRETVELALRTLTAMHRQPAAVERIIAHRFADEQIHAPTIDYPLPGE